MSITNKAIPRAQLQIKDTHWALKAQIGAQLQAHDLMGVPAPASAPSRPVIAYCHGTACANPSRDVTSPLTIGPMANHRATPARVYNVRGQLTKWALLRQRWPDCAKHGLFTAPLLENLD